MMRRRAADAGIKTRIRATPSVSRRSKGYQPSCARCPRPTRNAKCCSVIK
jgi:hypothetical protein